MKDGTYTPAKGEELYVQELAGDEEATLANSSPRVGVATGYREVDDGIEARMVLRFEGPDADPSVVAISPRMAKMLSRALWDAAVEAGVPEDLFAGRTCRPTRRAVSTTARG